MNGYFFHGHCLPFLFILRLQSCFEMGSAELKAQMAGVTTLVVAQRIGTIRDADRIIVLDEGRIVGQGTHSQLMRSCQVYREIAFTQLSEEELA